jgi:hypothetical protein
MSMYTIRGPRWVTVALAVCVGVVAFGCGSAGPEVSARRRHPQAEPAATNRPNTRTVRYRGVEFTVPGDWPVYDLEADPRTCVRFDVHAVYLGHPGADMQCPAIVVGRADAVLVEPLDGSPATAGVANAGVADASEVNGLAATMARGAATEHQVRAAFPGVGVAVTISYNDEAAGQQLLETFKAAP